MERWECDGIGRGLVGAGGKGNASHVAAPMDIHRVKDDE